MEAVAAAAVADLVVVAVVAAVAAVLVAGYHLANGVVATFADLA